MAGLRFTLCPAWSKGKNWQLPRGSSAWERTEVQRSRPNNTSETALPSAHTTHSFGKSDDGVQVPGIQWWVCSVCYQATPDFGVKNTAVEMAGGGNICSQKTSWWQAHRPGVGEALKHPRSSNISSLPILRDHSCFSIANGRFWFVFSELLLGLTFLRVTGCQISAGALCLCLELLLKMTVYAACSFSAQGLCPTEEES